MTPKPASTISERGITPDWAAKATAVPYAEFADPQSLNLYSYVRNIPTTKYDTDGHVAGVDDATVAAVVGITFGVLVTEYYLSQPSTQRSLGQAGAAAASTIRSWFHKSANNSKDAPADHKRPGTHGKPDHKNTAKEEAQRIGGDTEVRIPTPGGNKDARVADAAETGADGKYKPGGQIVQVIRPTPAGNVPKREQDAAQDIQGATGVQPQLVPVRPVPQSQNQPQPTSDHKL